MADIVQSVESALMPIVVNINTYLSNYILVFMLLGVGLWYSFKTKRHPDVSGRRALSPVGYAVSCAADRPALTAP